MKHAIIVTGGKQYRVAEGDVIFVEKLDAAAGESVKFDQVLAVIDGENATFGAPVVEGASVTANVVKSGKGAKVRVYKMKPKKGYRRTQGHRQPYTKLQDRSYQRLIFPQLIFDLYGGVTLNGT